MRGTFDALVIRAVDCGESDKLLTVLTAEDGQQTILAKGVRSPKSKLMPLCRMFTYANFEFYEKNRMRWLSDGTVISSFLTASPEFEGLALAAYITELTSEITGENVPCESILRMALNTLYAIEKKLYPMAQIKAVYEIFAAEQSGFSPDLSGCHLCEREDTECTVWLDVMNGCLECADCRAKRNLPSLTPLNDDGVTASIILPLERGALCAWRYVASAPLKRRFAFSLDREALTQLSRATEAYILNHLERGFDTLDFYHTAIE